MLNLLNFDGEIKVNGVIYKNSKEAQEQLANYDGEIEILINFKQEAKVVEIPKTTEEENLYIKVKQYMTQKSSPSFDFMKKYNNDIPMPLRLMKGKILEETKGMYKMQLTGVWVEGSHTCMRCMRKLTNPISQMYGIGPECGGHFYIAEPKSVEEFKLMKEEIKAKIEAIKWTGWLPKSAIEEKKSYAKAL